MVSREIFCLVFTGRVPKHTHEIDIYHDCHSVFLSLLLHIELASFHRSRNENEHLHMDGYAKLQNVVVAHARAYG